MVNGHEPWGMSQEPWAMSHEPLTINNRLINSLFAYMLQVLDIPKIISCFQEDIGPIFKSFKNVLDGSSSLFGARLFEKCQTNGFPKSWDVPKMIGVQDVSIFSCIFWSILV